MNLAGPMLAAMWLAMPAPSSQSGHRDVLLTQLDSIVSTGAYDFATGTSEVGVRVFARELDLVQPGAVSGNDPGFNAIEAPPQPHANLPPDTDVFVRAAPTPGFEGALFWDGQGQPRFTALPSDMGVRISMGGALGSVPPVWIPSESEQPADGLPIATTNERGELHQHVVFSIVDRSSAPSDELPPGVYALVLQVDVDGLESSSPIVLALGHEIEAETLDFAAGCLDAGLSESGDDLSSLLGPLPCEAQEEPTTDQNVTADPDASGCAISRFDRRRSTGSALLLLLAVCFRRRRRCGAKALS